MSVFIIDERPDRQYSYFMDIVALSTGLAQQRVQQEAAIQVQKMALDGVKDQGFATVRLLESAKAITDPSLGNVVDVLA